MRIACLLVPDLPLRAELRARPDLRGAPLVVASGPEPRALVIAVSPEAAAGGIHPLCSVAQARSVRPEVHVRVASPALEQATRDALQDLGLSFSPRVALAPRGSGAFLCEGAVFLDASGVQRLFRSETGFAGALAARAEALGLPGVVSIASSRSVALIVARRLALPAAARARNPGAEDTSKCHVLPPGSEVEALAPLPVDLLNPGDELAQELTRFGIHAIRDLLRLPRRALAQRLGPEILHLVAQARGEEIEAPLPEPRSLQVREAIDLEYAIAELEPLGFVLRGLLARLAERLCLRGLACGPIELALDLSGGGRDRRRISPAGPTRDPRVLLRLVMRALEGHPPDAAVESVAVATRGCPQRVDQLDLFRPSGPDPAALDRTLAELESLCGEGRVGAAAVADDHHPSAFGLEPFSGTTPALRTGANLHTSGEDFALVADRDDPVGHPTRADDPWGQAHSSSNLSPLVVRALRPPVRAEVRLSGGLPAAIRSAVACGQVLNAAGPWRTTGRWWSEEERFALDHFDIQVSDGTILRLCFDWMRRDWQIDAIYD